MTKEEIIEKILSRQHEIAKEHDLALGKVELCKKENDIPAVEFWENRCKECELLSNEYDYIIQNINK